jgi:hypothetical protein
MQTEDGVIGHRQPGCDIAHAEELVIDRLAMLLDQQNRARNLAVRNLVAEILADALQFLRVEMRAGGKIEAAFRKADGALPRPPAARLRSATAWRDREFIAAPWNSCRGEFSGRLTRHKGRRIQPATAHAAGRWRPKNSRK